MDVISVRKPHRHRVFLGALLAGLLLCNLSAHAQTVAPDSSPSPDRSTASNLRIGGPVFVPSALPPSSSPATVVVGATVAGNDDLPPVLFLEEVSETGDLLGVVAELRDDGEGADARARDGRYVSSDLQLGDGAESERYFRIRVAESNGSERTNTVIFATTDVPIGFRPSDPSATVEIPNGLDRAFVNQVVFTTEPSLSPRRTREIVAEVSAELGAVVEIIGYLPRLSSYRVSFEGEATYDAILRVAAALQSRIEVISATPSYAGAPSADWWLENIQIDELRGALSTGAVAGSLPVFGSSDVGVAIVEVGASAGVNCPGPGGLPCLPASVLSTVPACNLLYASTTSSHGTKVATLLAADVVPPGALAEGGAAPDVQLLPLRATGSSDAAAVLDCVVAYNATASDPIHVVNMSFEFNLGSSAEATLQGAVCEAACNNVLMVAAAGNGACSTSVLPFPGRFADSTDTCSCPGSPAIGDFMLRAGATNSSDVLGDSCGSTPSRRSHAGDIYAPGWGIPGAPNPNGTSWAAPLVSGCAAIRAAFDIWTGGAGNWNASDVEAKLRNSAASIPAGGLLDCFAAVQDPYDITFLLDRSGSMNQTLGAVSRWVALRDAVGGFTATLAASAPAGSRFGLTLFSDSLSEPMGGGLTAINAGLSATVDGHLGVAPAGSTGMGAGLKNAIAKLGAAGRPRVVVLFTDGEQNLPLPSVEPSGCTYSDGAPVDTGCPGGSSSGSVKIIPVGLNAPSSTYLTTLQALATEHRGTLLVADGSGFVAPGGVANPCTGTLDAAFDCAVAPALYGSSLQLVASTSTALQPEADLLRFSLNRDVARLIIKLSTTAQRNLDLRRWGDRVRISRDGVDVSDYFETGAGATARTLVLSSDFRPPTAALTGLLPQGEYVVTLDAGNLTDGEPRPAVRIVAFGDDHRLDMQPELLPEMPRVGQSLRPRLRLRWAGQPLADLDPDAEIVARVFRPGDDLGDLLAQNPATVDPASGIDAQSPGQQKFEFLLRTDAEFRARLAASETVLSLQHEGGGWYSADFDPGDVSGVYQVAYEVVAEADAFGVIEREAAQSVYVRFGEIDLDASIVSVITEGNVISLVLRPVTNSGRLIGPGQALLFDVAGTDARLTDVVDHQDGSYTLTVSANPESTLRLSVLGDVVYEGRADFDRSGQGDRWWSLLIVLMLALLIAIVIKLNERS